MKQDRLLCGPALRVNIPPGYDKYMEWGYSDGSVRFYSADNRKVGLGDYCWDQANYSSFLGTLNSYILVNCQVRFLRTHERSSRPG